MIELNDETIFDVIEKEPLVFIDFYASWCGSCRVSAPMFERVAGLEGVKIFKIDVEKILKSKRWWSFQGSLLWGALKMGSLLT